MNDPATAGLKLFCYDEEFGDDPHALVLELNEADVAKINAVREREHAGRHAIGRYVEVTDQQTGRRYKVASHPCGERCHCGAVALPADEGVGGDD